VSIDSESEGGLRIQKAVNYNDEDGYFWAKLTGAPPLARLKIGRGGALVFLGWEQEPDEKKIAEALTARATDLVRYAEAAHAGGQEHELEVWLQTIEQSQQA
jgi:hypothetical protein